MLHGLFAAIAVLLVSCSPRGVTVVDRAPAAADRKPATAPPDANDGDIVGLVKRVLPPSGLEWRTSYVSQIARDGTSRFVGSESAEWRSAIGSTAAESGSAVASKIWAALEANGCMMLQKTRTPTEPPGEARAYSCDESRVTATWVPAMTADGAPAGEQVDVDIPTGHKSLDELSPFLRGANLSGMFANLSKPALARLDLVMTVGPTATEAHFHWASPDEADEIERLARQSGATHLHRYAEGTQRYRVTVIKRLP